MRVKITLENTVIENEIILPVNYNNILQAFVYRNITKELSTFLHDKGYLTGKRKFKMFVLSRIFSDTRPYIKDKQIRFRKDINFYLSSPDDDFLCQFAEHIVRNENIKLGKNDLLLREISVLKQPQIKSKVKIKMLSPVTVYSTLEKQSEGGKVKKTYYYNPWENEFGELVKKNLWNKYKAFYRIGDEDKDKDFEFVIEPETVTKNSEKIVIFKGTVIKGWMGVYTIESDPEMIKFAYDTGLGSKNSQGFGMFGIIKERTDARQH